jgi:hypothetical protein
VAWTSLVLVLLGSSCGTTGPTTDQPAPATASAPGAPPQSACPQLVVDVPDDLVHRTEDRAEAVAFPVSVGVIWSNQDDTRVLNVSSAASVEEYGDGADGPPTARVVRGAVGAEIVVRGVNRITWQQPGATPHCTYWAVVAQGLSPTELDRALASVHEGSGG